jgi:NAD(P)-dependent dehydrogenase (short-subunit alcohol dehydrogenase family)
MKEQNPFSLTNKTILITGASSGIGRQSAITCAQMGARVILLGRNKPRLTEVRDAITTPTLIYDFDLTDSAGVDKFILSINKKDIKINGVIHSAGISETLPFRSYSMKKLVGIFETNVAGPLELTRKLIKGKVLVNENASIVFISSVMALVGEAGKTSYGMSKGAIDSAVRSLAIEFAPKGIRFNSILPGVVKSPMSDSAVYAQSATAYKKIEALHPLGIGAPDDVANACIYLLSDASRWVTGSNLVVDGGYTTR